MDHTGPRPLPPSCPFAHLTPPPPPAMGNIIDCSVRTIARCCPSPWHLGACHIQAVASAKSPVGFRESVAPLPLGASGENAASLIT